MSPLSIQRPSRAIEICTPAENLLCVCVNSELEELRLALVEFRAYVLREGFRSLATQKRGIHRVDKRPRQARGRLEAQYLRYRKPEAVQRNVPR